MQKINKQTVETVKTVVIAVLITGAVAFVGGMKFNASQNAQAEARVQSAVQQLKAE
jgi:hypothetical protein